MKFAPIVAREMKVLAANPRFYWGRALMAGFAVLAALQWFNFSALGGPGASGQGGFGLLGLVGMVMALGAVVVTADTVCFERREGTLPLLFLSTIRSYDVILGKLAAMGLLAFYALLGFAPILMLTLLLGGVTGGEVLREALVLVNVLFVSLTAGLCASALARNQMAAIMSACGLLAVINFLPYFVELLASRILPLPFSLFSVVAALTWIPEGEYVTAPLKFWASLFMSHSVGWALLLVSVVALQFNWRRLYEPRALRSAVASRRLLGAPRAATAGASTRRHVFAPVARAVLRLPNQRGLAWFAAVISLVGSVWNTFIMNRLGSVWAGAAVYIVIGFASYGVFAFLAGRFFFEARRSGELEMLMVTPVGARGILREQRLALLRMFRGPFYLILLGSIPVAVGCLSVSKGNELAGLLLGVCQLADTALGILAVSLVGMWLGARVNSALALAGYAVGLVLVLPIVVQYLGALFLARQPALMGLWMLIAPILMVLKNLVFIYWASRRLRADYRTRDRLPFEGLGKRLLGLTPAELSVPPPLPAS